MAHDVLVRLPRGMMSETLLSGLGITALRWDAAREAYVGRAVSATWNAMGQTLPWRPHGEARVYEAINVGTQDDGRAVGRAVLARFAAAAAAESGNGDDLRSRSRHREDARTAARVLEGLGVDPDAFAAMLPESASAATGRRAAASKATLRKFSRAAAVEDGNAFFGSALHAPDSMETQYLPEARALVRVLAGLGMSPDAFAAGLPDPSGVFAKRVLPGCVPAAQEPASDDEEDGQAPGNGAW